VSKAVGGVTTTYLVDTNSPTGYAQAVEELQGGAVVRQYTYGTDLISQRQLIAGQWSLSYYGYDGHGSVRLLTDSAGSVTDTYAYDAFGSLISRTSATPNEYLYAGERIDPETGLYHRLCCKNRFSGITPHVLSSFSYDFFMKRNSSPFKWRHFGPSSILLRVRWYCRCQPSYRDLEEMSGELGLSVGHATVWRRVQRYVPEINRRMRPHLKVSGRR
jgi:YD repeat-containing protein